MVKVSVIIPVYNCEKYLEQCIKSVLSQTLRELEAVCVDDGSTDSSWYVLGALAKEDARVKLFKQENRGAGAARNLGIKNAQGKYVAFLDADDYYLDNHALELMFQACENSDVPVCASRRICRIKQGEVDYIETFPKKEINKILSYKKYQPDYFYTAYLFQKQLLTKNGILFPDYRRYQDPPFLVKACYTSDKIVVLDICLYCYRMAAGSTRFNTRKAADLLRGIMDNLTFARQHNLDILFRNTVERLEYEYTSVIYESISPDDLEILNLLLKINQIICDKYEKKDYIVRPLRRILFSAERYEKELLQKFAGEETVSLYGAGKLTRAFLQYLKRKKLLEKIVSIVVSDLAGNASYIEEIPVISLQEYLKGKKQLLFVTVGKRATDEIVDNLKQNRYFNYGVIDDVFGDILLEQREDKWADEINQC